MQLKAGAFRIFSLLLAHSVRTAATQLLRDDHPNRPYRFELDSKDRTATITQATAVFRANEWAARFYDDPFLQFESVEWRIKPTRFWMVAFTHADTRKVFYAVVLPDGAIVQPTVENRS